LSLAAARLSASILFGIKANDAMTFAVAIGLLVASGALAVYIPARRAAAVAPVEALRHD